MLKKKRFLIGGLIIFLAIVFLGYMAFMSGITYYYEVDELLDRGSSITGQTVRVSGKVATDIEQGNGGLILRFTITDNSGVDASLPVVYQGVVSDTFGAGKQVVVEGQYTTDGIFEAQAILAKCSSKYVPEE